MYIKQKIQSLFNSLIVYSRQNINLKFMFHWATEDVTFKNTFIYDHTRKGLFKHRIKFLATCLLRAANIESTYKIIKLMAHHLSYIFILNAQPFFFFNIIPIKWTAF